MSRSTSGHVLKAMGIFGGVQVANILCAIVRTKLIAVWIGAAGVGLFAIFNGALEMIGSIAQLGIRNSAVRDISAHRGTLKVARVIVSVRRWCLALGALGALLTIALAHWLSQWTFGTSDQQFNFMFLGLAVLLNTFTAGEGAILQGEEKLKFLGKASLWGTLAGFIVSVPLYYCWRINSVVPSIIAYSICTAGGYFFYRSRTPAPEKPVTTRETIAIGRSFIILGIYMVASGIVIQTVTYVFTAWLNINADEVMVGYYRAGFTIVNYYVGIIFTAVAMEYYPRLITAVNHPARITTFVFHEMYLILCLLFPLILIFICAAPLIVHILYTSDFLIIVPFISLAMIGTVFRAISWCIAFTILARGDGKLYLLTESCSGILMLGINIPVYHFYGLTGLGVAYILWYVIYTIIVSIVYYRYGYRFNKRILSYGMIIVIISTAQYFLPLWMSIPIAVIAMGISAKAVMDLIRRRKPVQGKK